jgi:integrase
LPAEKRQLIPPPAAPPAIRRTFDEAANQLLRELNAEVAGGSMRITTFDNHTGIISKHLLPEFGDKTLAQIDVAAVKALRMKLMQGGKLRSRTQRSVLDTLSMVFGCAMQNDWTDRNPVWRLREAGRRRGVGAKSDARRPLALTGDELLLLEEVTRGRGMRLPVLLMAFCGMRRGEALGLQQRDFDADAETLRIERLATHGEITSPKADSGREVPVPEWVAAELLADLKARKVTALDGSDWLFTAPGGGPIYNNVERSWAVIRKALLAKIQDVARRSELAGLRLHDLRHSFATALAEQRVEPTARQALLGHKSLRMTAHYTHPSRDAKRAAAAALPAPKC